MKYYYFVKSLDSSNQEMLPGPRIMTANKTLRFASTMAQGPYKDLKELKKESNFFKNLYTSNPKRAEKILSSDFIIEVADSAKTKIGYNYLDIKLITEILGHSIAGKVNGNNVSGIHIYSNSKVIVHELIYFDNKTGVFEAWISVKHPHTDRYVKKKNKTTFFPIKWNMQKLVEECMSAYDKINHFEERKYRGRTDSGVLLEFIFAKCGKLNTVYPIVEY